MAYHEINNQKEKQMENIRKLESLVASWYKNMPHLPQRGQKWLAENVWWIVLVWVILTAMGVVGMLMATLFAGTILSVFGPVGTAIGGIAFVIVTITMLFSIALIVLGAMAVSPLKLLRRKGWTLLFLMILISVAADVLTFLFNFNFFSLVWGVLFAGVIAYFLYEIRNYFGAVERKKVPAKQKKAEA
jgi:uncharacterized membrane protein YhaH (DUF805 family)